MRSLAECLKKHGEKLDSDYISKLKSLSKDNKTDKYPAHQAELMAIASVIEDINIEKAAIFDQLKKVEPKKVEKPKAQKKVEKVEKVEEDEFSPDNLLKEWDNQASKIAAEEKKDEAKKHFSNAMDKFKEINSLLGERGSLENKEIDIDKYEKIKVLLQAALVDIINSGRAASEYVKLAIETLSPKARPYFEKFVKEDMDTTKEALNDTTDITGRSRNAENKDDRTGDDVKVTEPVQETKEVKPTKTVSEKSGKDVDGNVQPRVDKSNDVTGKQPEKVGKSDTAPAKVGDADTNDLGRDSGNIPAVRRTDHTITKGSIDREGSWRKTAENNLDAIELLKKINDEKRPATKKEQKILAKYVGWGASELANNIFAGHSADGSVNVNWYKPGWKSLAKRADSLLTKEELRTAMRSTQYAHYTSEAVVRSIYKALNRMGFDGGKILEPGMGIGNFIGLLPKKMRDKTTYTGVEMDHISSGIAKLLYPNQNVLQADFVKQSFPKNFFDAAIGNPPFGDTKILADPEYKKHRFPLHNYFFAKSLDRVRPGGLLVFVTSRYTMDSAKDNARKFIADRADLLGAIRLPQTAFKKSAGTEVVTDVLFLKKREEGQEVGGNEWLSQGEVAIGEDTKLINEYFVKNPHMVLGEHSTQGSMYSANEYTVISNSESIEKDFAAATKKLPSKVYDKTTEKTKKVFNEQAVIERDFDPKNTKEGGLYVNDKGQLMRVDFGSGVGLTSIEKYKSLKDKDISFLKSYVKLRDSLKLSHKAQLDDGDWKKALKALNKEYDKFVKKHGNLLAFSVTTRKKKRDDGTVEKIEYKKLKHDKLLRIDTENALLRTLETFNEDGEILKSPVLNGRTIRKPDPPKIESIPDALAVSLDAVGSLDIDHVAKTANKTKDEVIAALGDLIYKEPGADTYSMADEYLSGNVVRKLAEAKAVAKTNPEFERNVEALEKAQPEQLKPEQITIVPGVTWIPTHYYSQFANEALGMPDTAVGYEPITNTWEVKPAEDTRPSWQRYGDQRGYKAQGLRGTATNDYSTDLRGVNEILNAVLNNKTIRITYTMDKKTILDEEATAAANEKAKLIKKRFNSWVWEDADRANDLLERYNSQMNTLKGREYDGSHLTLPGMSLHFKPYDHQKRVVWRILQTGNTYLAHAVGAGKTFVMIAAGMEMKRLGMIRKPLYVVPNHMLGQFAQEFQELYPMANVLVADQENFHTSNRRRFVAQAALNDPDAVILTHSSFKLLKVKDETIAPVREEVMASLQFSLEEMEEGDEPRYKVKKMESRIEKMEQRFDSMISDGDNVVSFEQLGVDFLFVDEAHEFRKLDFVTNRQIKGIDPAGSKGSIDLYIKTLFLESQNPGRSHAFASGTPITNTLGELYSLMRFFIKDKMEEDGIHHFDSWANTFGEAATDYEMNSAGRFEAVERFSRFVNIPELMVRVRTFMDVLTSTQLGSRVKRPKIKGGTPEIVLAPKSEGLKKYQDEVLQPRIETSKAWKPSPGVKGNPDPIINIITDGRLASIDLRFVDGTAKNDPDSKLNKYIDDVIADYKESKDYEYGVSYDSTEISPIKGGAQINFYNSGFGKDVVKKRGFDSKGFVMKRLKEAGIPDSEVGWIDDYSTSQQKQALFKSVREGKKRILFGSAKKMGTGVNVQNRLSHEHYLDAPWYPADVEQPDGRILRQGNQNEEIVMKRYATKGSYDATQWQMVARKSGFIEKIFLGDKNLRSVEDISETSQYAMASALATGDERVVELVALRADIERLALLASDHETTQRRLAADRRALDNEITRLTGRVEELREIETKFPDHIGPEIDAKVGRTEITERKLFGAAVIKKYKEAMSKTGEAEYKIGTLNGVDVIASKSAGVSLYIELDEVSFSVSNSFYIGKDKIAEIDPVGITTKIVNTINGMPSILAQAETNLEDRQNKLDRTLKKVGAPFPQSNEYSEKIAEAAQLEQELAAEGEEVPVSVTTSGVAQNLTHKKGHNQRTLARYTTTEDSHPGQGVSFKDIQARFKNQTVTVDPKDGAINVRLKNGLGLKIKSVNRINSTYAIQSGRMSQDGVILGQYKDNEITLDREIASNFTRDHETYHFLSANNVITNSDKAILKGKLKTLQAKDKLLFKLSSHKDKAIAQEENEANMFAQLLKEREKYKGTGVGRMIQRVVEFIKGLLYIGKLSAMKLQGKDTKAMEEERAILEAGNKLADEVLSGKIFERKFTKKESDKTLAKLKKSLALHEKYLDQYKKAQDINPNVRRVSVPDRDIPVMEGRIRGLKEAILAIENTPLFQTSEDIKGFEDQESSLLQKAADIVVGSWKHRKDVGDNKELSAMAHILRSTMYNAEKVGGAYKRLWDIIRKKDDYKKEAQIKLWFDGEESLLEKLKLFKKESKVDYKALTEYLHKKDIEAKGFIVKKGTEGKYLIFHWKKNPSTGKRIKLAPEFLTEDEAWNHAMLVEANESKLSAKAKDGLLYFRKMSHNLYHHYAKEMQQTIDAYEKAGIPVPKITTQTEDGTTQIDLYAAMRQMGDLRGHYFPRIRNSGQFRVMGFKAGVADRMKFFNTTIGANAYRNELERMGFRTEFKKVGKLSEDLFQSLEPLLAQQQILNKALSQISNKDKHRILEDRNIKGEWRDDVYVLKGTGIRGDTEAYVRHLGGKYKDRFIGNTYRPEVVFENIPENTNPDVFEQKINDAILHSGGLEVDMDLEFSQAMVKQYDTVLKERGARARMISRTDAKGVKVIQGYETDALTALTQAMQAAAGSEAKSIIARQGFAAITGRDKEWSDFQEEHQAEMVDKLQAELDTLDRTSKEDKAKNEELNKQISQIRFKMAEKVAPSPDFIIRKQREIKSLQKKMRKTTKWADIPRAKELKAQIAQAKQEVYADYLAMVEDRKIDNKTQNRVYKEATATLKDILKNQEFADQVVGTLKGLAVWQYLGLRVSSAAVNVTNMGLGVPAAINGETDNQVPIKTALRHIVISMKNYVTHRAGRLTGEQKVVFDEIRKRGWDDPQLNREAFDVLASKWGKGWNFALEKSMYMFGKTEELNRASSIAAAYFSMKEKHKGEWNREEMLQKARDISDKAHGSYGVVNRPYQMRGDNLAARTLQMSYVFTTFTHNYLQEMYRLGFHKGQWKAMAYMALAPSIFGVGATVPMGMAKAISKALGGDDPEEGLINLAEKSFGAGDIARNGLMGVFDHGINLRGSLAVRFGFPSTFADLFGAPGSVVSDIWDGSKNLTEGYYLEGLEKIAPAAIGNVSRGIRESTQGVTTRSGTPVFWGNKPLKGDSIDMIIRMLSFNPTNLSKKKEIQWAEYSKKQRYQATKSDIYKRLKKFYSNPPNKRKRSDLIKIKADIRDFNLDVKDSGMSDIVSRITTKSIKGVLRRVSNPSKREKLRAKEL